MGWLRWILASALLLLAGPLVALVQGEVEMGDSWRTASRESAGIAPDPATTPEAVVQAYAARAWGWRGVFGVHSWIAVKPARAAAYTVYQVIGWRKMHGRPVVATGTDVPDRYWFGNRPELLVEVRGDGAGALIARIDAAARAYPFAEEYRMWPGPNSNTFTAFIARAVPALGLELPVTAIGKDYLANGALVAPAPSGTGYQLSLFGLAGVLLATREGLEVNLLGLAFGIDPLGLALKLPGLGRIGLSSPTAEAAGPS